MPIAAKSRSNLHKKKCDFNKLVLNKMLYFVVFNCINFLLTAKYTSEKLIAK